MRYVRRVSRIRYVAHEYWFELLIAFLAIAGMLELVAGRDSPAAPPTTPVLAPEASIRSPSSILGRVGSPELIGAQG